MGIDLNTKGVTPPKVLDESLEKTTIHMRRTSQAYTWTIGQVPLYKVSFSVLRQPVLNRQYVTLDWKVKDPSSYAQLYRAHTELFDRIEAATLKEL